MLAGDAMNSKSNSALIDSRPVLWVAKRLHPLGKSHTGRPYLHVFSVLASILGPPRRLRCAREQAEGFLPISAPWEDPQRASL